MDASHPSALPPLSVGCAPLSIRQLTGLAHFTFAPFRVRVPFSSFAHKNIPTPDGIGIFLVRHEGLEPPTFAFVVRDSIQLS